MSESATFIEFEVIDPVDRTVRGTILLSVGKIVAVSAQTGVTAIYIVGTDDYLGPVFTSMPYEEVKSLLQEPVRAAA